MDIKERMKEIIKTCGGVIIVDKSNDSAFSVLFGVGACNKKPVADDDLYGKHVLLERFYKKDNSADVKIKLFTMSESRVESAYLYYTKMAKTMLEFFYRNGYHEAFQPSEGLASPQLAIIEKEDHYDLYAYYAYKDKEVVA